MSFIRILFVLFFQGTAGIIVGQYFFIFIALRSHYGSADLEKSYTVSPAGSGEDEPGRYSFFVFFAVFFVDDESGAVEMGIRQDTAYFQFFPDGERPQGSCYFQPDEASGSSPFYGD